MTRQLRGIPPTHQPYCQDILKGYRQAQKRFLAALVSHYGLSADELRTSLVSLLQERNPQNERLRQGRHDLNPRLYLGMPS